MTDESYRELIRNMPCFFCGDDRYGYVSWHHLKCLFQSGTSMKSPPWATIPVCGDPNAGCHSKCHSYEISRSMQIAAMLATWVSIGVDKFGAEKFWAKLGNAFWELMNE